MAVHVKELVRLYKQFGRNTEKLLEEYPELTNLKAFSDRREGLLEWYDFKPGASLLSVGAGMGALVPMLLGKGLSVTVLDSDPDALELVRLRTEAEEDGEEKPEPILAEGTLDTFSSSSFDYILFDGSLPSGTSGEAAVRKAKSILKPDGVLIAAVDHIFGIRAFAGAEQEDGAMGRAAFERLLRAGEAGTMSWYYPEPLRTLPNELFSDRRQPGAGELSRVIPAYGFPTYLSIDVGRKYDEVCRDGVFPSYADAFLVFWTRGEHTDESGRGVPVYIKYNRNRRKEYQLKTVIRETAGPGGTREKSVEKAALFPEGVPHIKDFRKRYDLLMAENRGISYVPPVFDADEGTVSFPWVKGRSLTEAILTEAEKRAGKAEAEGKLSALYEVLTEALERITGGPEVHNLDAIFDNYLVMETPADNALTSDVPTTEAYAESTEKELAVPSWLRNLSLTGIDYEWVTDEPADVMFVRYRILRDFHERQKAPLSLPDLVEFLARFGISRQDAVRFERMEQDFQDRISGGTQSAYLDRFISRKRDEEGIRKTERDLQIATDRLQGFRAELRDKETLIRKMTEVKRLTDNHVTNLEAIIRDLRHENEELGKLSTYLNGHQTLYSRLRRKAGDAFNRKFPKGSKERKILEYRKEALLHPIRQRKLMSTAEGRNRMEGDFAIGDLYRQYGKLSFPVYGDDDPPRVSVVIPCYNQIEYTYACLVSILQHTDDVRYEIIIADDVSTDATKHLERFADGLIISRNEVNQGFLRNCNQAAKKARGEFIFFLNNDTTVTDGWLSALVELMDRDSTVGMSGSKLIYPDGRLQEAGGIIWSDASGWNYGRLQDPDLPEFNYVKDVDYISGAAILIRKSLWEEIGGFDERYAPAYCEDSDLAFEVRKHGYRVVYQPKSVITHFEGISNGTDVQGTGLKRYQVENTEKLKEKWKDELAKQFENTGNPDPFRARERSGGKKIILVVDHYVPTYDRDAGSRTTWQYLRMFVRQGYVVKFIGDNFAHEEPYTTALQQLGIEVLYGPKMQNELWSWIEAHAKDLHLVYLNRPHIASKYIDFIQSRTDVKVIYYGHDLHFLRERREYELTGDVSRKEASEYWKAIELSLMHKADMSYYPSEVECEAIHRIDPEIRVKAITAYLWEEFPEEKEPEEKKPGAGTDGREESGESGVSGEGSGANYEKQEGLLFVGGFAHPPNADAVTWFVKEVWPLIRKERPELTFHVVGSRAPEEILSLDNAEQGIKVHGFVSDEELARLYRECLAVVVPLRYGAGVKGKVIEAMYYGAPVVTTPVGAEGIPGAGDVMRIADGRDGFARAVLKLLDDPTALQEAGRKGLQYVKEHHSLEAAWDVIREDFS